MGGGWGGGEQILQKHFFLIYVFFERFVIFQTFLYEQNCNMTQVRHHLHSLYMECVALEINPKFGGHSL